MQGKVLWRWFCIAQESWRSNTMISDIISDHECSTLLTCDIFLPSPTPGQDIPLLILEDTLSWDIVVTLSRRIGIDMLIWQLMNNYNDKDWEETRKKECCGLLRWGWDGPDLGQWNVMNNSLTPTFPPLQPLLLLPPTCNCCSVPWSLLGSWGGAACWTLSHLICSVLRM